MFKSRISILIFALVFLTVSLVEAGEFRSMIPVNQPRTPTTTWQNSQETKNLSGLPSQAFLDRLARDARNKAGEFVRTGMNDLFEAWNDGNIESFLSPTFYDRQRFLDALLRDVPRDSRVRLLSIESVQPFDQVNELIDAATGMAPTVVPEKLILRVKTKVSAIVRTQVEFNDATKGFQRREGRNEFFVDLNQDIPLISER